MMLVPVALAAVFQALASDSLTLDAALALARARRGLVVVAGANVASARADWRVSGALPNPTASYSFTESPPRQHATMDQSFDFLLRRGSDRAVARAGIAAALADSVQLVATVEREARIGFFETLAADRVLALARDEAGFADTLAALAARRLAAGEISRLDALQATLEAARARQLVSVGREQHAAALAVLARALALSPDSLLPLAGLLDDGVAGALPLAPPVDELPLVRRERADSAAARARATAARRARIPLPVLQAGVEWNDPSIPAGRALATLGFSLPLPLWQSGGGQAAAAESRALEAAARLREARATATQFVVEIGARVRETARRALVARDSILPLATRQRELAVLAYRAGETGVVPVLDALRAERQVARDLVADLVAFQRAHADWFALIGVTR